MIRATVFTILGGAIGLVSLVGGLLGLSQLDRDPSSSGAYFALAVIGSPFAILFGGAAGVFLHWQLQRMGR